MTEFPDPASLLPHAGEMIFVDQLLIHEELRTTCRFTWNRDSPFSDEAGCLPVALLIEVAAQAVGLHVGLEKGEEEKNPQIGFLIGINQVQLPEAPLPPGVECRIEVEQTWNDQNYGVFIVKILDLQENPIFSGQLKLFQPNPEELP